MLFKESIEERPQLKLVESIKKDLAAILKQKGINVASVRIEMKSGNMNIEVCMKEENK